MIDLKTIGANAQRSAHELGLLSTKSKNALLLHMADAINTTLR